MLWSARLPNDLSRKGIEKLVANLGDLDEVTGLYPELFAGTRSEELREEIKTHVMRAVLETPMTTTSTGRYLVLRTGEEGPATRRALRVDLVNYVMLRQPETAP